MNFKQEMEFLKELEELNQHRYKFDIDDFELNKARKLIDFINNQTASTETPQHGDYIEYLDEYGEFYQHARIERIREDGTAEFCERPSIPFTSMSSKNTLSLSMSGGKWGGVTIDKLTLLNASKQTMFKCWGKMGACGDGAFNFNANVKVWKYEEQNKFAPYTTKEYNKYYVSKIKKEHESDYLFSGNGFAFKNHKEFNAWLLKKRAIVFKNWGQNSYVVFTYKTNKILMDKKDYDTIAYDEIDRTLCNGSYIEVKNVINDETKTITEHRYHNHTKEPNEIAYQKQLYINDSRNKENDICIEILKSLDLDI